MTGYLQFDRIINIVDVDSWAQYRVGIDFELLKTYTFKNKYFYIYVENHYTLAVYNNIYVVSYDEIDIGRKFSTGTTVKKFKVIKKIK